jgi:hypothetical protein
MPAPDSRSMSGTNSKSCRFETCGERILMLTGPGSTETAPHALFADKDASRAGFVGLAAPGVELKLAPAEEKFEARLRGPNITPGYWRQYDLTRAAFDEEGFYKLGDALLLLTKAIRAADSSSTAEWWRISSFPPAPGSAWDRCGSRPCRRHPPKPGSSVEDRSQC